MYKLIVMREKKQVSEYVFEQGTVSIGRNGDNDVQLDDQTVSGLHAKIISFFKPTYIQDQRSTNGTFVNGTRVQEHTLQPGDVIAIGTHKLLYNPTTEAGQAAPDQNTVVLSNEQLRQVNEDEPQD